MSGRGQERCSLGTRGEPKDPTAYEQSRAWSGSPIVGEGSDQRRGHLDCPPLFTVEPPSLPAPGRDGNDGHNMPAPALQLDPGPQKVQPLKGGAKADCQPGRVRCMSSVEGSGRNALSPEAPDTRWAVRGAVVQERLPSPTRPPKQSKPHPAPGGRNPTTE